MLSWIWGRRGGCDHAWCFVLLSSWEGILKVDEVEGGENGDKKSNLAWGIWGLLNLFFFTFILRLHSHSHVSVKGK